jgi:hypothetical protein
MQCGTCSPRLQQGHHPTLFEPSPNLLEGMMPVQHREHQGFDSTPTREPMRRVRGDEMVITVATSRRRTTPRTKGKCAVGCMCCTNTAMMHLLS